jgi:2-deoxy-D-gluconate 3-dehydrogenase
VQQKPLRELLNLQGKAAIVTGGARGIGYAVAYRLAEAGANVMIADKDVDALGIAITNLRQAGFKAESVLVNVTAEEDVVHMIDICREKFLSVDILVNNAGIFPMKHVSQMSGEDFESVLQVNLLGAFYAAKHAAEIMKTQPNGGKIINITSVDALHPTMIGLAHYDASKHGLWGFTKNLALELAPYKIAVNAIAPGGILTPGVAAIQAPAEAMSGMVERIPMRRFGDADEIGKVALFLASDMSSYVTGAQVIVDGGVLLT